jgi:hypothetical protein
MEQSEPDSIISRILRSRSSCAAGVNKRPSFTEEGRLGDCSIEVGCFERLMVKMAPWSAIAGPISEARTYRTNFPTVASIQSQSFSDTALSRQQ